MTSALPPQHPVDVVLTILRAKAILQRKRQGS
jgi:hypothetical protein